MNFGILSHSKRTHGFIIFKQMDGRDRTVCVRQKTENVNILLGELNLYAKFCDYLFNQNVPKSSYFTNPAQMRWHANLFDSKGRTSDILCYTNNSSPEYIICKNKFFVPVSKFHSDTIFLLFNYILLHYDKFDPHICSLASNNYITF